jgi:hypothetical protein
MCFDDSTPQNITHICSGRRVYLYSISGTITQILELHPFYLFLETNMYQRSYHTNYIQRILTHLLCNFNFKYNEKHWITFQKPFPAKVAFLSCSSDIQSWPRKSCLVVKRLPKRLFIRATLDVLMILPMWVLKCSLITKTGGTRCCCCIWLPTNK